MPDRISRRGARCKHSHILPVIMSVCARCDSYLKTWNVMSVLAFYPSEDNAHPGFTPSCNPSRASGALISDQVEETRSDNLNCKPASLSS